MSVCTGLTKVSPLFDPQFIAFLVKNNINATYLTLLFNTVQDYDMLCKLMRESLLTFSKTSQYAFLTTIIPLDLTTGSDYFARTISYIEKSDVLSSIQKQSLFESLLRVLFGPIRKNIREVKFDVFRFQAREAGKAFEAKNAIFLQQLALYTCSKCKRDKLIKYVKAKIAKLGSGYVLSDALKGLLGCLSPVEMEAVMADSSFVAPYENPHKVYLQEVSMKEQQSERRRSF